MGIVLVVAMVTLVQDGAPKSDEATLRQVSSLIERCRQSDAEARRQLEGLFLPDPMAEESPDLSPAVDSLRLLLADRDPANRIVASSCLGELGPLASPARAALTQLLRDPDPQVQLAAACALLRCGARASDPATIKARNVIIEQTRNRFFKFFHENVPPRKGDERYEVLGALGDRALAPLVEELEHADNTKRSQLILDLYQIGLNRKPDDRWETRPGVAPALAALKQYLDDPDPVMRLAAAQALAGIREPSAKAAKILVESVGKVQDLTQFIEYELLGRLGESARAALPELEKDLDELPHREQVRIAACLLQIDPANGPAERVLLQILKSPDEEDLLNAALAAAHLGDRGEAGRDAIPALIEATRSSDRVLSLSAHEALAKLDPAWEVPMPVLVAGLKDADYHAGLVAIEILKRMGPRAREAIPALMEAAHSRVRYLRVAAARCLDTIRRGAAEPRP